jgi:hypothetical protein
MKYCNEAVHCSFKMKMKCCAVHRKYWGGDRYLKKVYAFVGAMHNRIFLKGALPKIILFVWYTLIKKQVFCTKVRRVKTHNFKISNIKHPDCCSNKRAYQICFLAVASLVSRSLHIAFYPSRPEQSWWHRFSSATVPVYDLSPAAESVLRFWRLIP